MNVEDLTIDTTHQMDVEAPPEKIFAAVLHRLGSGNSGAGGEQMPMELELKPGGRWYRDRGNGVGHLWGFVQVIKPPTLLELSGPLFMSYPVSNHIEVKIEPAVNGCKVTLRHRGIGMIDPGHRTGVGPWWNHLLAQVKKDCE